MIAIPDNFEEATALLHFKESEFEQATESLKKALAHGRTGEQELNTMNELARDLAELAGRLADRIQEKLGSF